MSEIKGFIGAVGLYVAYCVFVVGLFWLTGNIIVTMLGVCLGWFLLSGLAAAKQDRDRQRAQPKKQQAQPKKEKRRVLFVSQEAAESYRKKYGDGKRY